MCRLIACLAARTPATALSPQAAEAPWDKSLGDSGLIVCELLILRQSF
jgi:hypothetical protein